MTPARSSIVPYSLLTFLWGHSMIGCPLSPQKAKQSACDNWSIGAGILQPQCFFVTHCVCVCYFSDLYPSICFNILIFIHRKFVSDTETIQHKHKYKQNTKYNDQVYHIIILRQT